MKRTFGTAIVAVGIMALATMGVEAKPGNGKGGGGTSGAAGSALVLYDSSGDYGHIGEEYAILASNLLGHFDLTVERRPVSSYVAGAMSGKTAVVYLGSTYGERSAYADGSPGRAAYDAFLADAAKAPVPILWVGYNIWELGWRWNDAWGAEGFTGRFGLRYEGIDDTETWDRVRYSDTDLLKGVVTHVSPGADLTGCRQVADGSWACMPWLSVMRVADTSKASVIAEARSSETGATAPYLTRGGNLWYVGDFPFAYSSEEDRYLAIADILHDVTGIDHPVSRRALVRFEDVSGDTKPSDLEASVNVLRERAVPFGLAVIPSFQDPFGVTGPPRTIPLSESPVAGQIREYAKWDQAFVVQHGTTHQWEQTANPYNAMSGDDFEFYRVTENSDASLNFVGPLPGADASWATSRTRAGADELKRARLDAFAWEAPHYTASETVYHAVRDLYDVSWGRSVYYAQSAPNGRFIGQFFPYMVKDIYGFTVISENLHDVAPDSWNGYAPSLPSDILRRAAAARVVRDGFASFFFHPYLDANYLREVVDGIRDLGYEFVSPCTLVGRSPGQSGTCKI